MAFKLKISSLYLVRRIIAGVVKIFGFEVNSFKSINYNDIENNRIYINNLEIVHLKKGISVVTNGLRSNNVINGLILDFGKGNGFFDRVYRISQLTLNTKILNKIEKTLKLDKALLIISTGELNFSHYLIDLTLIYYAKKFNVQKVVIGHQKNSTIEHLLAPFKDIIEFYYADPFTRIDIGESFILIQDSSDFSDCERIVWFKRKIVDYLDSSKQTKSPKYERVYLTRISAKRRNIINLEELEDLLIKYNFTFVDASKLDIQEQYNLMNHATVVIGAHGQNLTAAFFINHCLIIDLTNDFYLEKDSFHRNLFKCLGFNHIEIADQIRLKDNIVVDISKLDTILKLNT